MDTLMNLIVPIFAIMFCGFLAGRFSLVPKEGAKALNGYIYYFALPALLFLSLAEASREEITSLSFIAVNIMTSMLTLMIALGAFFWIFKKPLLDSIMYGMASTYGNTGFLGIPLAVAAFGPEAAVPAAIVTFISDLLIITFVVLSYESSGSKETGLVSSMAKALLMNPINLSLLLGSTVSFLHIPIPETVDMFADTLGAAAGPTALFAIGLGLMQGSGESSRRLGKKYEVVTVFGLKLIGMPLAAWCFVTFFFEGNILWAKTAILLSAMPTGAVVNVFAQNYRLLEKQMPQLIVSSTLLSMGSIMILLLLLI